MSLLALFFLSGFSGLLYEVVWLRMFVRAFGSSAFAASNVLAVFMGGLALGAWLAGRRSARLAKPLAAYGFLELGLALAGVLASLGAARLPELFARLAPEGVCVSPGLIALRSALACAVLLAPTALMGASLPWLAEHQARREGGPGRLALLYGVNTFGAVAGVLLSGFYSLGAWGERRTVFLAAALNAAVGLAALGLARREPALREPQVERVAKGKSRTAAPPSGLARRLGWAMAASGFCALALEVLWTRMGVLLLGNSVYAFSTMLAAYLLGIGGGSLLCARWLKGGSEPGRLFYALQALCGAAILAAFELYRFRGLARPSQAYLYSPVGSASDFASVFLDGLWVILPATLAYGALFPAAAALADRRGGGAAVGRLYAMNTVGAVLGALAGGFLLIPALGTRWTAYALACAHLALGCAAAFWERSRAAWLIAVLALAALWTSASRGGDAFLDILKARLAQRGEGEIVFHEEGASSTVTGYHRPGRETLLLINGITVSGKGDLGRFMAHFPLLLRESRKALVICLGAGNTFRAALEHGVETDLVELEPEVLRSFPRFWPDARAYTENPRARLFANDGRNFLLTSRGGYDAIIVDGTPPIFSAGAVNLYTREFVALARRRLAPGGILALWIPLPCFEENFWMIARGFTEAFPHALAWAHPESSMWGVLLLGSDRELRVDVPAMMRRARARGLMGKDPWLQSGLFDPAMLLDGERLRARARAYPAVSDDRPYTEFPLPLFLRGVPAMETPRFLWSLGKGREPGHG